MTEIYFVVQLLDENEQKLEGDLFQKICQEPVPAHDGLTMETFINPVGDNFFGRTSASKFEVFLSKLSAKYPDVFFTVFREGEEYDDRWWYVYKNGIKHETCLVIDPPPIDRGYFGLKPLQQL